MADWDLKPSRILMNVDTYRDLVGYGLCEEGWSESEAQVEADRRIEVMSKDHEIHLREAVESLSRVDFNDLGDTFAGLLLRGSFNGTFPPGVDPESQEEFFSSEGLPRPLVRAYRLGISHRGRGLTDDEEEEWISLQMTYP
jgi:hypothetical protein